LWYKPVLFMRSQHGAVAAVDFKASIINYVRIEDNGI
jgi:hypothetical protein